MLADNRVGDLDDLLAFLGRLPFLRILDLQGNPVAEEGNYRSAVVRALPSLEVLDCVAVTAREREAARAAKVGRQADTPAATTVAFGASLKPRPPSPARGPSAVQDLERRVRRIRARERREKEERERRALESRAGERTRGGADAAHGPRDSEEAHRVWQRLETRERLAEQFRAHDEGSKGHLTAREVRASVRSLVMARVPRSEDVKAVLLRLEQGDGRATVEWYVDALVNGCGWEPMPRERRLSTAEKLYAEAEAHLAAGRAADSLRVAALAAELDPRLHEVGGGGRGEGEEARIEG